MVMVNPLKKKRHVALKTVLEAGLGHKSIKQVYAERRELKLSKTTHLTGTEKNLLLNDPRLKIQMGKGGWTKVTYLDPNASGLVTFSIQYAKIKDIITRQPSRFFHPAEAVYSKWINESPAGKMYTARRQVEGMLKVALKRGDVELADKITQILKKSDSTVAQFRADWVNAHSDVEISDWYDYDDVIVW